MAFCDSGAFDLRISDGLDRHVIAGPVGANLGDLFRRRWPARIRAALKISLRTTTL